jgi:hypothetical protein
MKLRRISHSAHVADMAGWHPPCRGQRAPNGLEYDITCDGNATVYARADTAPGQISAVRVWLTTHRRAVSVRLITLGVILG